MKVTVRAMTTKPTGPPSWMSPCVEVDVPPETSLRAAFDLAPIGPVQPAVFNDFEWWVPWLKRPNGDWFPDFGIPWAISKDGFLVWDPSEAILTVGELLRSIDEGILDADRSCIHFWAPEGLGANGPELLHVWPAFVYWLELVAAGITIEEFIRRTVVPVLQEKWRLWYGRGAKPASFIEFMLSRKDKGIDTKQAATLFSEEEDRIRAVARALGFVETHDPHFMKFDPDDGARELLRLIDGVRGASCYDELPEAVVDRLLEEHHDAYREGE